ncbi:protein sidekick-2-like [Dendronephthya gigantea]|uniref:protein sidekick-2-like n=1 Tax=Dendronephthya gigantea TaxID=151771 RepID=UPI0010694BC5|nr:protein sidekick-2-like [Dendronephthya gigantea]XP_028400897.1 protein sidekick-2-like [Dendronephthya gigantea]XP_028400898.1 protein sidekick-2-like [Dendronephthya gigantea]
MFLFLILQLFSTSRGIFADEGTIAPVSAINTVDLTSSSFAIRWSHPPGISNKNRLSLKYIVCVRESDAVGQVHNGSTTNNIMNGVDSKVNNKMVNGILIVKNNSIVNGTEVMLTCEKIIGDGIMVNCKLVNGSMVVKNSSLVNGTEVMIACNLGNGSLVMLNGIKHTGVMVNCKLVGWRLMAENSSLVDYTEATIMCSQANGSLITVNMTSGTDVNCKLINGSLVMINSSMETSVLGDNCTNVGEATLYSKTGLKPSTEYIVSVKTQSHAGFGPKTEKYVTTMEQGGHIIYVELVSRIQEDVMYRHDAQSHSSITVGEQRHTFDLHGMHFIVLDPKTGSQTMQGSFNTHDHSSASTQMAGFLSTIPKPSIILMVVYFQAHDYYTAAPLLSLCPNALLNYTSRQSWSMICLNGFGTLPWVTSLTSNSETGPAVIETHILLPKELKNAPNLTNVVVTSARSFELNWIAPATDNYTGGISYYEICYQKSNVPVNGSCSLVSAGSDVLQATVNRLHPYQQYRIRIRGVVALGYGPYSNTIMAKTHEAVPAKGPSRIYVSKANTSSILIRWTLPLEKHRNGIIRKFSICYEPYRRRSRCYKYINKNLTDRSYFVDGLRPHSLNTFKIKAATAVGFGRPSVAYLRSSQAAPDGPPTDARATQVEAKSISLSWLLPAVELRNGWLVKSSVCVRVYNTSPGHCQQHIELEKYAVRHTVTGLKPYTKYAFEISVATKVGNSPTALVVSETLQAAPSGPPADIQITNYTHNRINVTWSPPDHTERNGVITKYWLCIKNQTYKYCLESGVVPPNQTSYVFNGLRPYRVYQLLLRAATKIAFGLLGKIIRRTAPSEPSGPPTEAKIKYVDESTIGFFWSPPHPELRNGIIIHYRVCIREYGPNFACIRTAKVLEGRGRRSYAYGGLNPNKEYVVVIRAATIVGPGPPAFVQKTKGECDLPLLHSGDYVSEDSFSASGFLGRGYAPHHARIDGYRPWCDSGLKNNTFVQVDFGGPLRVTGVATRRHDEHWKSWVSSYEVSHSLNNVNWQYVNVSGKTVVYGNNKTIEGRLVTYFIDEPIFARFVRFRVLAFVGLHPCMGVQIFGCAPAIRPTAAVLHKTAWSIQVSWQPLPSVVDNGMIFGYKICHKLSSSDERRCAYVDHNATTYNVTELIPHTNYDIEISAGTVAGYGPPVLLRDQTNQSVPSGPPRDLRAQTITGTSIELSWSIPHRSLANGIIIFYGICYQEASLETDCANIILLPGTRPRHKINEGLRPYTEYMLVVMAATKIPGWSPKAVLYSTTLPAAPSGPPTSMYAVRVAARILHIFWRPPEAKKQNGVIIGYRLCIKEKRSRVPCRNYVTLPEKAMNMYSVDELKPYTLYNIHVEAKTAIGYGPARYLDQRTGEAAPSEPPRVAIKSVTTSSIEITWSPPEKEKRNGVIALYEVEVFEEMAGSKVEKIARSLARDNNTSWRISNLSPRTDYIFHIKAGTAGGFGPAVIIHKRSEGHVARTDKSNDDSNRGKPSSEITTGVSILLIIMVAGFVLSIMWNKGMLPNTRARRLKIESRRRRRRARCRKRKRKEISESDGLGSAYSELDDYQDAPVRKQKVLQEHISADDLYGMTRGDNYTVRNQDIYGNALQDSSSHDIYVTATRQTDVYKSSDIGSIGVDARPKGVNTVIPPVVPKNTIIPPVIPLEATLSSVFIKLPFDPNSSTNKSSTVSSNPKPSTAPRKKDKRKQKFPNPKLPSIVPQLSKFTSIIAKQKILPTVNMNTAGAVSRNDIARSDFTQGPAVLTQVDHSYGTKSYDQPSDTQTLIESFYEPKYAAGSGTDISGDMHVSPVPILRTHTQQIRSYPASLPPMTSSPISSIPMSESDRRRSTHHHPNMPRYSVDFGGLRNLVNPPQLQRIPSFSELF